MEHATSPRTCILLAGPIRTDPRYINIAQTLSALGPVDIYYYDAEADDARLFTGNVSLIPCTRKNDLRRRFLRHSFFYREYDSLFVDVRRRGVAYDIVLANDLPMLEVGVRLARSFGGWLVYGSDELYLETLNQFFPAAARWPKSKMFAALVAAMRLIGGRAERRAWDHIDLLLTPNGSCRDHLVALYGAVPSCVLMSCPRLGDYPRTDRIRQELGLPTDSRIVLYQGMMNRGRCLELLVRASRYFGDGTRLVLLGRGPLRDTLRELAAREALTERVAFLPPVPYVELLSYTASADLGVIFLDATNLSKKYALANKVFEYMACGLPLLVSNSPEQAAVVAASRCGEIVDIDSPAQLGSVVRQLLSDPQRLEAWGRNARAAFRYEFNWERQGDRLLKAARAMLASPPACRRSPPINP